MPPLGQQDAMRRKAMTGDLRSTVFCIPALILNVPFLVPSIAIV